MLPPLMLQVRSGIAVQTRGITVHLPHSPKLRLLSQQHEPAVTWSILTIERRPWPLRLPRRVEYSSERG
jgi:hypothetical protein